MNMHGVNHNNLALFLLKIV